MGFKGGPPMKGPMKGMPPMKRKMNFKVLFRVLKLLFKSYPVLIPIAAFCVIFSAGVSAIMDGFRQSSQ